MVEQPVLRRRSLYQAAMFSSFSIFWTAAPIILLRQGYSSSQVALFALAGVAGVFAAPIAGRLADRNYIRPGTILSIGLGVLSFALAWFGENTFWMLVLAGIVIDLGVQGNMVLSQREIFQLDEAIRSRLNSAYMTTFFIGGAIGSALTSPMLETFGWTGICLLGGLVPLAALAWFAVAEEARLTRLPKRRLTARRRFPRPLPSSPATISSASSRDRQSGGAKPMMSPCGMARAITPRFSMRRRPWRRPSCRARKRRGRLVLDQFDRAEHPFAAHVADIGVVGQRSRHLSLR